MRVKCAFFYLCLFLFPAVSVSGVMGDDKLDIAKDGRALMHIVLPKDSIPAEQTAAAELKKYLDKVTGGNFKVVAKPDSAKGNIYLGRGRYIDNCCNDIDFKKLATDGILIRVVSGNLILTGGRPRGTLNAVYTFLQDYIGCQWWTADSEYIPQKSDLSIDNIDCVYVPQFQFREYLSQQLHESTGFEAKMRQSGREFMKINQKFGGCIRMGAAHTMFGLMPPKQYFKDHPDWYALNKKENKRKPTQLCMTNQKVKEQLSLATLKWIENDWMKDPNWKYGPRIVSISCADSNQYCQCKHCLEVVNREQSQAGPLLELVNYVAKKVHKKYPDVLISTLAYWGTDVPPKHIKPEKNVLIQLGTLDRNHKYPVSKSNFGAYIRKWKEIAEHFYIWDYDTHFANFLQPHPNHFVLPESLKFYSTNNVSGVFVQGSYSNVGAFVQMRAWLACQLMWNPRRNTRGLMKKFIDGYYGSAGKYMLEYIDLINEAVNRDEKIWLGVYDGKTEHWLTLGDMNRAEMIFAKAFKAVEKYPEFTKRVEQEKLSLDVVWVARYHELKETAVKEKKKFYGPENPQKLLDKIKKNKFGISSYKEWAPFSEYMEKLQKGLDKKE